MTQNTEVSCKEPGRDSTSHRADRLMNLTVIYGSVREARQGIRVAHLVEQALKAKGHKVILVDPKVYDLPLLDKRYADYKDNDRPESLTKLANIFQKSDGFVIVSGEYNGGIPPALKNLLDHFPPKHFYRRPVALVTYSVANYGGIRVVPSLRHWVSSLSMLALPQVLSIGSMHQAIPEDGTLLESSLKPRLETILDEFLWVAHRLEKSSR